MLYIAESPTEMTTPIVCSVGRSPLRFAALQLARRF